MNDAERSPDRENAIAAYYDRLALVYGEGQYFRARRLAALEAAAAEVADASSLLDLGCGNGGYLAEFTERLPLRTAVGADLSPEMLAAARRRLGGRVELVRADAVALPFPSQCLDVVFMSHVVQLVPDLGACVAEVARVLRSGGRLIATVGSSRLRSMLSRFFSSEELADLPLLGPEQLPPPTDQEREYVSTACRNAGLQVGSRSAAFAVSLAGLVEWVRIRWLSVADEQSRLRFEQLLEQLQQRAAGASFSLVEELIVARKPVSAGH
jgi:ubiquinone/menaquinone biosynthesis C-methylase UbiE